jgi:two-component system LytT family response regulator
VLQQVQHLPRLPLVVFVTAYDHYALQAFDYHAVDYLLKPLDPDSFARCLAQVRQRMAHSPASGLPPPLTDLLRTLPLAPATAALAT